MELDFKGTWRTRNYNTAYVEAFEKDLWSGDIDGYSFCWDKDGKVDAAASNFKGESEGFDLMERISERWSSERSGGENG